MSYSELRPALIVYDGPHTVGKNTTVDYVCKLTSYRHVQVDRGLASNYAFAKLYDRPSFDLTQEWQCFFANERACVVHFALGGQDFANDIAATQARREQWVGLVPTYDNALLDQYIAEAVDIAKQIAPKRVLTVLARSKPVDEIAHDILAWLASWQ